MKKAFSAKYWEGDTVYYETVGFRYDTARNRFA